MGIFVLVIIGFVIYYIAKSTGNSFEATEKRLLKDYESEIMGVNTVVEDTWRNFHKDVKKHEIRSQRFTDTAYGSREGVIMLSVSWMIKDKKEMNEEWIWKGYYALAGLCFYGEYWQAYSLALALQRLDCEKQGKWTLAAKAKNLQSYAAPLPTEKEFFLQQDTGAVYKRFMEKDGDEFDEKDMKTGALLMWHYEEKDYQKASAVAQKMLDANKDALVETKLTKGVHELFYLKAAFAMQTRYGSQVQTPKLNDAEIKGFVARWQREVTEKITNKLLAEGAYIVKYFLNAKEKAKALEFAEQLIKLEAKMGENKADNDAAVVQDNSLNKQWQEGGFCRKCGAKMVEGGTFCVKCGTKAEVRGNMAQIDPFGFKKGLGTIVGEPISKYTAGLQEGVGYITSESNSGEWRVKMYHFPILEAEKYFDTVGGIYYFSDFWTYSDSGKILGAGYTTGFRRENLPTVYETVLRRHEILRQELNKEATCSFYSFNKGEGETQMSFSQLCELMRQGRRGAHILYWDVEDMEVFFRYDFQTRQRHY